MPEIFEISAVSRGDWNWYCPHNLGNGGNCISDDENHGEDHK
jgi:hypothetical protein